MKWAIVLVTTMLLVCDVGAPRAEAQVCGQWQTGIGPNGAGGGIAGTNGAINSLVSWDPDGDGPATELAVISGGFSIAGTSIVRVARDSGNLHGLATWDGERWAALPAPPDHLLGQSLTLLGSSGSMLVAAVRLYTSSRIVVFENGEWTQIGEEFTGDQYMINTIAVQNGQMFAGGRFNRVGQSDAINVARWDGVAWQAMGSGLSNGRVNALAIHRGEVVAGGTFTTSGQTATTYAAKWNGTEWEQMGTGATAPIHVLASVGELLFASRATYGGANLGVMIWNGEAWANPSVGYGSTRAFQPIASMTVHDGVLWAAGSFAAGGMQLGQHRAARWVNNGWELTGSARPIVPSANSLLLTFRDNEPIVAATSVYIGFTQPVVPVRHYVDGDWHPAGDGFDGPVNHLVDLGEGRVMAVGPFTGVGGRLVNGVAMWNGSAWEAMDAGLPQQPGPNSAPHIRAAAMYEGDPIIVGTFASVGGDSTARSVAKWNGQSWGPLGAPGAFGIEPATGMGEYAGELLVSRRAGSYNARTHQIRRFDGETWTDLPGELATPSDTKRLRLLQFGPDLIAAGDITSADGVQLRGIARWNGLSWSAMGEGFEPNFTDVKVCVHDEQLYALTNGVLYRWDDPTWHQFSPYGLMSGYTGELVSDGNRLWTSSSARGLVHLDGEVWRRAGGSILQPYASALLPFGNDLLVAGAFLGSSDGRVVSILARWTPEPDAPTINPLGLHYNERTGSSARLDFTVGGTGPYRVERVEHNGFEVPFDYPHRVDTILYSTNALHVHIPSLVLSDAGDYVITVSNGCGDVSSTAVTLDVQCAADFDSDGQIAVADIYGFLAAWFVRDESANYDGNHLIDIADLFGWLSSWLGRC